MGCLSHRTLSILVGYLYLVVSVAICILLGRHLMVHEVRSEIKEYEIAEGRTMYKVIGDVVEKDVEKLFRLLSELDKPTTIGILTISIVMLVSSLLLLIGISVQRHRFMVPWLWSNLFVLLSLLSWTIYSCVEDILEQNVTMEGTVTNLLDALVILGFILIIGYPVYKFYKKLCNGLNITRYKALYKSTDDAFEI
ncbi:uncharacterized protein [Musca autumnalis]|uniref:uncharacterized protein n=1 Tax=Musca autumnalis TaxID=221902 RepID=UPI003CEF097D